LGFLGGKGEFIRLGVLDDVDMAMMTHSDAVSESWKFGVGVTNNGMVAKWIRFSGVAAHAGAYPQDGINALNAANIALTSIHAQRETFRDEDSIRIHPIITQGGIAVSSVPADVRMETFVRGSSLEAIQKASVKVDRALRAGAMAVGGSVTITTLPGYLPITPDPVLEKIYVSNAVGLVGEDQIRDMPHRSGSTDMGDVSQIMPAIHPYASVATGNPHGNDYLVQDYELGVLTAAKAMACTAVDLLADGAQVGLEVKNKFQPTMTKNEYVSLMNGLLAEETFRE
jgi:metal-dependent amidase/aminoacylase/carboxypeptidase family protein